MQIVRWNGKQAGDERKEAGNMQNTDAVVWTKKSPVNGL